LRQDRRVPEPEVRELLVAQVLDDLDEGGEVHCVGLPLPELEVLRAEPGDLPLAADADRLARDEVHRRRADERGDEQVGRVRKLAVTARAASCELLPTAPQPPPAPPRKTAHAAPPASAAPETSTTA